MAREADAGGLADKGLDALSDLTIEGLVHVAQVRSPVPRGRLLSIAGRPLPRGYTMISARDMAGGRILPGLDVDIPILIEDRISWRGETVALIAGPDPCLASELAASVELRWEEEEPDFGRGDPSVRRITARRRLHLGNPALAFATASKVIEGTYRSSMLEHFYSEPQGALAYFDYDRLVVRTATQWPSHVRDSVASVLGSKPTEIRVRPTRLGTTLDGKLWYPSLLACHAALAAKTCKAPARILLTREEDFRYSPKGARSSISLRAALGPEGRLSALEGSLEMDIGAYGPFAENMLVEAGAALIGAYGCPNLMLDLVAISTDTPPAGAFAGLGSAQASFALECLCSRLAESLDEDPIVWKTRNILPKGRSYASGEAVKDESSLVEIGRRLAEASDFRRRHSSFELLRKRRSNRTDGPLRGMGFAFGFQCDSSPRPSSSSDTYFLEARLGKDLRLSLVAGAGSNRGGASETWRATAARILGLPPESIDILPPDTDLIPVSGPDTRSRGIALSGRLVSRACTTIQKKRFREALPISVRVSSKVDSALRWTEDAFEGSPFGRASWAGAVVEVELEPWTLRAVPRGIWLCVDGGLIASPDRARRALRAAAFDALGASSSEAIGFVDGRVAPEGYFSYSLPLARELPEIAVDFLDGGRGGQSRGIGELPFTVIPPAFLSAVSQAAGYALSSLPAVIDQVGAEEGP